MDEALGHFLELRLRARGRPAAMAKIDRGLHLLARIQTADRRERSELERELSDLRRELNPQFVPPDRILPR